MKTLQLVTGAALTAAVLVIGLPMVLLLVAGALLVVPWRPRKRAQLSPAQWRVWVGPAKKQEYDYDYDYKSVPVQGETAVRLVRGKEQHPIGVIQVSANEFERNLQALITKAQDRANTLNAYGDGLL